MRGSVLLLLGLAGRAGGQLTLPALTPMKAQTWQGSVRGRLFRTDSATITLRDHDTLIVIARDRISYLEAARSPATGVAITAAFMGAAVGVLGADFTTSCGFCDGGHTPPNRKLMLRWGAQGAASGALAGAVLGHLVTIYERVPTNIRIRR